MLAHPGEVARVKNERSGKEQILQVIIAREEQGGKTFGRFGAAAGSNDAFEAPPRRCLHDAKVARRSEGDGADVDVAQLKAPAARPLGAAGEPNVRATPRRSTRLGCVQPDRPPRPAPLPCRRPSSSAGAFAYARLLLHLA